MIATTVSRALWGSLLIVSGLAVGSAFILALKDVGIWRKEKGISKGTRRHVPAYRAITRFCFAIIAFIIVEETFKIRIQGVAPTVESILILAALTGDLIGLFGILYWIGREGRDSHEKTE